MRQTNLSKNMGELCDGESWRVMRMEGYDFPLGTILFEVTVGEIMKEAFVVITPELHNGLFVAKTYPQDTIASFGLTMEGALYNAVSRVLTLNGGV